MATYFRVTVYHPAEGLSGIFDSNGMFEKLWQFSSYFIQKGFKIIEASGEDKFLDVDLTKAEPDPDKIFLRACVKGRPEEITHTADGIMCQALKVGSVVYIPDKAKTGGIL